MNTFSKYEMGIGGLQYLISAEKNKKKSIPLKEEIENRDKMFRMKSETLL